jgi:hypothetical protein
MNHVCISRVCLHAADLVRGKTIHLREEERAVFEAFSLIGYVHFKPSAYSVSLTLCTCLHPALFEFYFYYRWLPSNLHLFRLPPRRAPA